MRTVQGHFNKDTAKDQHKLALDYANAKAKTEGTKEIKTFQPYVLRHTALTQLAEAGCDVFTLARIAGHSSITITQRYVHPHSRLHREGIPADSESGTPSGGKVSTAKPRWAQNWAQCKKGRFEIGPNSLVRKGGLEPPRFYPPDPKSGASANSATFALFASQLLHIARFRQEERERRPHRTNVGARITWRAQMRICVELELSIRVGRRSGRSLGPSGLQQHGVG